jgi:hypothetical protein
MKGEEVEFLFCPWPYQEGKDEAAIESLKNKLIERWKQNQKVIPTSKN